MIRRQTAIQLAIALLFCAFLPVGAQEYDIENNVTQEEFRWGVSAFHSGLYNDALLSFSRALSLEPDSDTIRAWLGRAYFASGFTEAALDEWQFLLDGGVSAPHIAAWVEALRSQQANELADPPRYVTFGEVQGRQEDYTLFLRPTSIYPLGDGSFLLSSYATRDVLHLNVNGTLQRRFGAGFNWFEHPFDIVAAADGRLFVSDFGADQIVRLTPQGARDAIIGSSGIDEGQLMGPQYLAIDEEDYIYVTDWGNQRVAKFDPDGEYVLSFGGTQAGFVGLDRPTGIVYRQGLLYVVDAGRDAVAIFDTSGNFRSEIGALGLTRPERLSLFDERHILIADGDRLALLDPELETIRPISELADRNGRIVAGARDINGHLLAVDFDRSRIIFLSDIATLYSGMSTRIEQIDAAQFPQVEVDVAVEDRQGRPIVGLEAANFVVSEAGVTNSSHELLFADHRSDDAAIIVLIDRSPGMRAYSAEVEATIDELLSGSADSDPAVIGVVRAGESPVLEAGIGATGSTLRQAAAVDDDLSPRWAFDRGVRLAGSELANLQTKRMILFVTQGSLPPSAFDAIGLQQTAHFLTNNHIAFYVVYTRPDITAPELEFLVRNSGGQSRYLYNPRGIADFIRHRRERNDGRYTLRFTTPRNSDFGRAYLPVEVESYLIQKSGRDESGYFGPLEF